MGGALVTKAFQGLRNKNKQKTGVRKASNYNSRRPLGLEGPREAVAYSRAHSSMAAGVTEEGPVPRIWDH